MRLTSSATQEGIDWDGLLMLSLSILSALLTFGFFWFWRAFQCYRIAQSAETSLPDKTSIPLIVFGKQLHENRMDEDFKTRLNRVSTLQNTIHPDQKIFLLGGITNQNTVSEAQAGADALLAEHPELSDKLVLEESSRNTLENLKQARIYLNEHNLPLQAGLITNRYHLNRCQVMAKGLGLDGTLIAAEDDFVADFQNLYKIFMEAFFIHWYHTGSFISRWLNNKRMLSKIH
ncbi:YdcF family protein [Thiomicrorhabdus sp. ZW0627]|uniref:YdcF family protein n=1 Tax=Thiomicrorhabdus sp. ZW0627 TaxID=3039774 RepID=UPI002436CA8D|nr:YdcF family protein [Thiomicrorhabdus sp. ZW0627]MDG6774327.1 YdcF family protein [Thiomicrorhabdus sp. ZW0627]